MAYITLANAKKIVRRTDLSNLDLKGEIYKIPIHFLSKYEKASLLAIQELLKDPEKYFTEIYQPFIKGQDTFTYVYEAQSPAYHLESTCELLSKHFINFEIPEKIREQGEELVKQFRKWFEEVRYLFETDPAAFLVRLHMKWDIIITDARSLKIENSGNVFLDNYDISQLESEIDSLIKSAGRYYYANPKNTIILNKYSKHTYLARSSKRLEDNTTGFSDQEVKEFLAEYDSKFKRPLMNMLIEYYRLKLNPEIKLNGTFLEQLNFKPCGKCHGLFFYQSDFIETVSPDLPF